MKKRNQCVVDLKTYAITRLSSTYDKDSPEYQTTLKNLIIQVSDHFQWDRIYLVYWMSMIAIGYDQAFGG